MDVSSAESESARIAPVMRKRRKKSYSREQLSSSTCTEDDEIKTTTLSSSESSIEDKRDRKRRNIIDISSSSGSDDEGGFAVSKKRPGVISLSSDDNRPQCSSRNSRRVGTKKRRRICKRISSDDSDDDVQIDRKMMKRRRIKRLVSSDNSDEMSSNSSDSDKRSKSKKMRKKNRRDISSVMEGNNFNEQKKRAEQEESILAERVRQKQNLIEGVSGSLGIEKIILNFDPEKEDELVTVDENLAEKLQEHQIDGIKFMWNRCFESIQSIRSTRGSGCILAHCMGLGKSLQIVTLTHTLLSHENVNIKSILILCPVNTIINWKNEFSKWGADVDDWKNTVKVHDLSSLKITRQKIDIVRAEYLENWIKNGGVMILSYELFRSLHFKKNVEGSIKNRIRHSLLNPGPDVVICDEGHVLKNDLSKLTKLIVKMKTRRRIVLSGTPLQNNLMEYYTMINFVKPYILGTKKEFLEKYRIPIENGKFKDSKEEEVGLMKGRTHALCQKTERFIQRKGYAVLKPLLPPKKEYVILTGMNELQTRLYKYYIENECNTSSDDKNIQLFKDLNILRLVWSHPLALKYREALSCKKEKLKNRQESDAGASSDAASESNEDAIEPDNGSVNGRNENGRRSCRSVSLRGMDVDDNFNDNEQLNLQEELDDSEESFHETRLSDYSVHSDDLMESESNDDKFTSSESSETDDRSKNSDSNMSYDSSPQRGRAFTAELSDENENEHPSEDPWWHSLVSEDALNNLKTGPKLSVLFEIIRETEKMGEKILVFLWSIPLLKTIEFFLRESSASSQTTAQDKDIASQPDYSIGQWVRNEDYFVINGEVKKEDRSQFCERFNDPENKRGRLFLISTKAGGLGINLVAANRIVLVDAAWNPSADVQSIFRAHRMGQKKECYIYHLVSSLGMEKKIFERQIVKLSISKRIVDEEQTDRLFSKEEVGDLYEFDPVAPLHDIPTFPEDPLLNRVLEKSKGKVVNCQEYDWLFKNTEEDLTEAEREAALRDLEEEEESSYCNPGTSEGSGRRVKIPKEMSSVLTNLCPDLTEAGINEILQPLHNTLQAWFKEKTGNNSSLFEKPESRHSNNGKRATPGKRTIFNMGGYRGIPGDRETSFFGMGAMKKPTTEEEERLRIKEQALLHYLLSKLLINNNEPPTFNDEYPLKTPCTRVLHSWTKEPADIIEIFQEEFCHWLPRPKFSIVNRKVLVHLLFCPRLETLNKRLSKYDIGTRGVGLDVEAAKPLLGSNFLSNEDNNLVSSDNGETSADSGDKSTNETSDEDLTRMFEKKYGTHYDSEYAYDEDTESDDNLRYIRNLRDIDHGPLLQGAPFFFYK